MTLTLDWRRWWTARAERERSFGLQGLDHKVAEYLPRGRGFFVEAGANDGVTQSNTFYLERARGWRGLLIEPLPELAAKCRQRRPKCAVEHCALVASDFVEAEVTMQACNLMSLVPGAMGSAEADAEHLRRGAAVQGIELESRRVPAATLTAVLEKHGVKRIDFLSLDVEGYELEVLRGLDLERFSPAWLLVETRDRTAMDRALQATHEPVAALSHQDTLYRAR